jgi:chromosome segregation ATPase
MITRKTEHPFYTVTMEYDETKTETDYEKELMRRYVEFLDKMQEMREMMAPLKESYYHEEFLRDDMEEELQQIESRYNEVDKAVKQIIETTTIDPVDFPLMRNYFNQTNKMHLDLDERKTDALRQLLDKNDKVFSDIFNWFEGDESEGDENNPNGFAPEPKSAKMYSSFDDYAEELYKNYDNYSLDMQRFDEDVNEMKEAWSNADKEWDSFYAFYDQMQKHQNKFQERYAAIDNLAVGLAPKIQELETILESKLN